MLVYVELQNPSGSSTELTRLRTLQLLKKVFEGFSLHPFFFILSLKGDPPLTPYAHQTELLFRLQFRKPIRVLIGDEIGLGKTIEGILIGKFLEKRDGIKRVLIVVPRILVQQWISELKRFFINPDRLEKNNLRTDSELPEGWYVASIDLIKREEYKDKVTKTNWDLIIVDEAHRVGMPSRSDKTKRYELVEELAKDTKRDIVLLSATPHRGNVNDYLNRLRLVDPLLISENDLDEPEFYKRTLNSIVIRRTKMDVNEIYEKKNIFKRANLIARVVNPTEEEKSFYNTLFTFLREKLIKYHESRGEEPKALPLLLTLIAKRASSSPKAAFNTLDKILSKRLLVASGKVSSLEEATKIIERELEQNREIKNLKSKLESYLEEDFNDYEDIEEGKEIDTYIETYIEKVAQEAIKIGFFNEKDVETLKKLEDLAKKIMQNDSRLKAALKLIQYHLSKGDKVVLFTEYKDSAEYIYKAVKGNKITDQVALITSEQIKLPGFKGKATIENVKDYLKKGKLKIIISTDVASEGLNLQVANVLINYEPTWSPVKIEQRLGRVWRLGQEKDVFAYTIFLGTDSDKDVLEILYKKLLATMVSLNNPRVTIGEEIALDEENATIVTISLDAGTLSTGLPVDPQGKPKYTEYKAIVNYLHGREALESYVQEIINTLQSLKKMAEKLGLTKQNMQFRVDVIFKLIGNLRDTQDPLEPIFKKLVIKVSELKVKDSERNSKLNIGLPLLKNIYDYYQKLSRDLSDINDYDKPIYLLSSKQIENIKELHLFKVAVFLNNRPTYSEVIGFKILADGNSEIVRGKELIKLLNESLDAITATVEEYQNSIMDINKNKIHSNMCDIIRDVEKEMIEYIKYTERNGLSKQHNNWKPRDVNEYDCRKIDYIGSIIYTTSSSTPTSPPPPYKVKEIEKKAMEIAMKYERSQGRDPQDVSDREHYDILSIGSNEVRYIEVKGKAGLDLKVELTEAEFETAKEKGENYWLYIVYGIETDKPRILAIRDPIRNVKWMENSTKRYIFTP